MFAGHSEIVDVDLAALLLELFQLVGGDAAHDNAILRGGHCNEGIVAKKALQIALARTVRSVRIQFIERLTERPQQGFHERHIIGSETANVHSMDRHSPSQYPTC